MGTLVAGAPLLATGAANAQTTDALLDNIQRRVRAETFAKALRWLPESGRRTAASVARSRSR